MASEESKNEAHQANPAPDLPSERLEDNVSSDGQAHNETVGRAPMATWRLTLVLAWYEETLSSLSRNDYKKQAIKLKLTARSLALASACSYR